MHIEGISHVDGLVITENNFDASSVANFNSDILFEPAFGSLTQIIICIWEISDYIRKGHLFIF